MRTASVGLAIVICMLFIKAPRNPSLTNEQTLESVLVFLLFTIVFSAMIQDLFELFK